MPVNSKSNLFFLLLSLNVKCVLLKKMRKTHDLIWESTPLFIPSILSAIIHWKIFAVKNVLISDHITNLLNTQPMAFQYSLPFLWPWRYSEIWALLPTILISCISTSVFNVLQAHRSLLVSSPFSTLETLGSNVLPRMSWP